MKGDDMATVDEIDALDDIISDSKHGFEHYMLSEALGQDDDALKAVYHVIHAKPSELLKMRDKLNDMLCHYFDIDQNEIDDAKATIRQANNYDSYIDIDELETAVNARLGDKQPQRIS